MRATELIEYLEAAIANGDDPEVRLASQPSWPFEYAIANVVTPEDISAAGFGDEDIHNIVYISEGSQLGYLPADVTRVAWR